MSLQLIGTVGSLVGFLKIWESISAVVASYTIIIDLLEVFAWVLNLINAKNSNLNIKSNSLHLTGNITNITGNVANLIGSIIDDNNVITYDDSIEKANYNIMLNCTNANITLNITDIKNITNINGMIEHLTGKIINRDNDKHEQNINIENLKIKIDVMDIVANFSGNSTDILEQSGKISEYFSEKDISHLIKNIKGDPHSFLESLALVFYIIFQVFNSILLPLVIFLYDVKTDILTNNPNLDTKYNLALLELLFPHLKDKLQAAEEEKTSLYQICLRI